MPAPVALPVELIVVCYDVADDRRRRRLVRVLEGYGVRVQESVFECWLDAPQQREMEGRARAVLDAGADRLVCRSLTPADHALIVCLGRGASVTEDIHTGYF